MPPRKPPNGSESTTIRLRHKSHAFGHFLQPNSSLTGHYWADRVPFTPQTGQFTVNGIRPLTGSTSNLYFWPQLQIIFTSIKFPP
jgi:hypothetical protein